MIQQVTTPPAGRPRLAIEDEEIGPRLREVRVLTPDEAQRLKIVERLRDLADALEAAAAGQFKLLESTP